MSNFRLEDEFIDRTEKNLRAIDKLKEQGEEVYEVTQLINSLLGLLVYPRERIINKIPNIEKASMVRNEWPLPSERVKQASNLTELIRFMRNAVAHLNIEFKQDENEIVGIQFINYAPDDVERKNPLWIGDYQVEPLRRFVFMLLNHIRNNKSPR